MSASISDFTFLQGVKAVMPRDRWGLAGYDGGAVAIQALEDLERRAGLVRGLVATRTRTPMTNPMTSALPVRKGTHD
jgi:hypothetical protein